MAIETPLLDTVKYPADLRKLERSQLRQFLERGCRQLPLLSEEGAPVGIVASRDVLRFLADHFPETLLNLPPRLRQAMPRPEGG